MRRRRNGGFLATIVPLLALLGEAQGVVAKHDGAKTHRRSRMKGTIEARQLEVDLQAIASELVNLDLLPSSSSASASTSATASPSLIAVSESALSSSAIAPSSAVSEASSAAAPTSSESVAAVVESASTSGTPAPSSASAPAALVAAESSTSQSASVAAASASESSASFESTGGAVRPNTPGKSGGKSSNQSKLFHFIPPIPFFNITLFYFHPVDLLLSPPPLEQATKVFRWVDRQLSFPVAEARAVPRGPPKDQPAKRQVDATNKPAEPTVPIPVVTSAPVAQATIGPVEPTKPVPVVTSAPPAAQPTSAPAAQPTQPVVAVTTARPVDPLFSGEAFTAPPAATATIPNQAPDTAWQFTVPRPFSASGPVPGLQTTAGQMTTAPPPGAATTAPPPGVVTSAAVPAVTTSAAVPAVTTSVAPPAVTTSAAPPAITTSAAVPVGATTQPVGPTTSAAVAAGTAVTSVPAPGAPTGTVPNPNSAIALTSSVLPPLTSATVLTLATNTLLNTQVTKTDALPGQPSATSTIGAALSSTADVSSVSGAAAVSSAAVAAPSSSVASTGAAATSLSVDGRPPTTLLTASTSSQVIAPAAASTSVFVPGVATGVSSTSSQVVAPDAASTSVFIPAVVTALSSTAESSAAPIASGQPSSMVISINTLPPTTLLPPSQTSVPGPASSGVEPLTSTAAAPVVVPSSSAAVPQPASSSAAEVAPSMIGQPSSSAAAVISSSVSVPVVPGEPVSSSATMPPASFPPASSTLSIDERPPTTIVPVQSSTAPTVAPAPSTSSSEVVVQPSEPLPVVSSSNGVPAQVTTSSSSSFVQAEPTQPPIPSSRTSTFEITSSTQSFEVVAPAPSSSSVVEVSTSSRAGEVTQIESSSAVNTARPSESSSLEVSPPLQSSSSSRVAPSFSAADESSSTSRFGSASVSSIASVAAPSASVVEPSESAVASSSSDSWSPPAPSASSSSTKEDIYIPTQTWLIVASTPPATTSTTAATTTTSKSVQTGATTTAELPTTAVIPNSVPTLIVPANSAANKQFAGSGSTDDPLKDTTLISLLLAADQYPWTFVVKSADATSQLFNTFPKLVSSALEVEEGAVQTYGLQVYQPASWNGDQAALLTQWLAYIPDDKFDTLNAYLKAGNSPLFNQTGIQGELAAQINTAFPLAANSETAPSTTSTTDGDDGSTRTRDIIIGVCVGIGGLLWIALVFWIYKRIKRNNDRAVHKRLSEHMSMFDDRERENRRYSVAAPSLAPSEVDGRPSSFYASPMENDPAYRRQQRRSLDGDDSADYHGSFVGSGGTGDRSPTYHPSVFGTSWFANPQGQGSARGVGGSEMRQAQNPFEDIVTRSYLQSSGSLNGGFNSMAQRRSGPGRPVHKAMIGQPTLHASSLEFREQ